MPEYNLRIINVGTLFRLAGFSPEVLVLERCGLSLSPDINCGFFSLVFGTVARSVYPGEVPCWLLMGSYSVSSGVSS